MKLKLYKGNIINAWVSSSPAPCTTSRLSPLARTSDYDQTDSQGFINLWGLPDKEQANCPGAGLNSTDPSAPAQGVFTLSRPALERAEHPVGSFPLDGFAVFTACATAAGFQLREAKGTNAMANNYGRDGSKGESDTLVNDFNSSISL